MERQQHGQQLGLKGCVVAKNKQKTRMATHTKLRSNLKGQIS